MTERETEMLHDLLAKAARLGRSDDYPQGKLNPEDEGGLRFAVGQYDGKVMLDFGTPTKWIGMEPQQAADLAGLLLNHARKVARERGLTIEFRM